MGYGIAPQFVWKAGSASGSISFGSSAGGTGLIRTSCSACSPAQPPTWGPMAPMKLTSRSPGGAKLTTPWVITRRGRQPPPYKEPLGDSLLHWTATAARTGSPRNESILFQSAHGHRNNDRGQFASWLYQPQNPEIHISRSPMPVFVNLWCHPGHAPSNGREVEMVIRAFKFTPRRLARQESPPAPPHVVEPLDVEQVKEKTE